MTTGGNLDAWIADHDIVVDAAAPYALNLFHATSAAERRPVEHARKRTRSLLDSVIKHRTRLAYVSTLSARRVRSGGGLDALQSQFIQRLQPYFEIKTVIEDAILEAVRRGLEAIIVSPSACLGPWDIKPRHQCWIPALLSGELSLSLQHRINVVDTRDVADTLVGALLEEAYGNPIAVIGHDTSVNDLFSLVCDLGGADRPRWSVPAAFGVLPALWAELAWGLVGRPSPLPSLVPMLLCEQEWLQTDPALDAARKRTQTFSDNRSRHDSVVSLDRVLLSSGALEYPSHQAFDELFVFRSRQSREQSAVFMIGRARQPMSHATRVVDTAVSVHHLS